MKKEQKRTHESTTPHRKATAHLSHQPLSRQPVSTSLPKFPLGSADDQQMIDGVQTREEAVELTTAALVSFFAEWTDGLNCRAAYGDDTNKRWMER